MIVTEIVPWNSVKRIEIAKKKLHGGHPVSLIDEELGMSRIDPAFIEGYRNVLQGDEECIRNQLPHVNLTVDQQVSCLIDIATDPAILGVCYDGFIPWI